MDKTSSKNNKLSKENKISEYFTKRNFKENTSKSEPGCSHKETKTLYRTDNSNVLCVDNDEGLECSVGSKSPIKRSIKEKLKLSIKDIDVDNVLDLITNLPKEKKSRKCPSPTSQHTFKKRKYEKTPSPDNHGVSYKKSINQFEDGLEANYIEIKSSAVEEIDSCELSEDKSAKVQSTSKQNQQLRVTLKTSPKRMISVKTPEKINERIYQSLSPPLKISARTKSESKHSTSVTYGEKTPTKKKNTPRKKSDTTPSKIKNKTPDNKLQKTPNKNTKYTPAKLFSKSPKHLNEFNVEVLENFVKVTPSKSNKKGVYSTPSKSPELFQDSILSYMSPLNSSRSEQVQTKNESTPTKLSSPTLAVQSVNKAKLKLDFTMSPKKNFHLPQDASCTSSILKCTTLMPSLDDSWEEDLGFCTSTNYTLNLSESQHCKVLEVNNQNGITLLLESTTTNERCLCSLEGFWANLRVHVGDILHVSAVHSPTRIEWYVNNDDGLVVYDPDHLISSTLIVGGLFCKRRSVLSERYRGFEPSNKCMIVGILVHELLQKILKVNASSCEQIELIMKRIVRTSDTIHMLYASSLTIEDMESELYNFVPKISTFMNTYVRKNTRGHPPHKMAKLDWQGKIDSVQDIEENIWCPELGIKGKVDVSVKVGLSTMPLELKTGRTTVSLEHRGQVILYIMMMTKMGYTVPSGLLLYLKEGVLREIPMNSNEKRDLIILRNELVYYLTRQPKISENVPESSSQTNTRENGIIEKAIQNNQNLNHVITAELPEPINHHSACGKCPYNMICCTYTKFENVELSENHYLRNVQLEVLSHLKPVHLEYFINWSSLIALEGSKSSGSKQIHEIYTVPPKTREQKGKCMIDMHVISTATEGEGLLNHTFKKMDKKCTVNLQLSGIGEDNYVVVSTEKRPAVAAGLVTHIDSQTITIALDRDLNNLYSNGVFHLDTYESSVSQSFNMTCLALLLEDKEQPEQLRKLIIEKAIPKFQNKLPKAVLTKGSHILRSLNKTQQRAVLKSLTANDYMLIKGMPGTGKTATIVALIRLLVELKKSVLITSHTHTAVDNVCLRLLDHNVDVLRLGSESRIHPNLRCQSEHALTKNCNTPEQLEEIYHSAQVIAVTCLGSGHPVLSRRSVDVCIVDESTQVLQCSVFRVLCAAKKFILIGDPDQLPPVVKNRKAIARGFAESLFERLHCPESTVSLNLNYRMNSTITNVANRLTYKGELLVANDSVANATLELPNKEMFLSIYQTQPWIVETLDDLLLTAVQILNTGPVWNRSEHIKWLEKYEGSTDQRLIKEETYNNCTNPYETSIVGALVRALLEAGVPNSTIGVIAPYRAQVAQISLVLKGNDIEVSTVDQFQGRDKHIIIYSCTKSCNNFNSTKSEFEILEDKRRLTVAVTRAKHKFILIGDVLTIRQYTPFAQLLNNVQSRDIMDLLEGERGFHWQTIMNA